MQSPELMVTATLYFDSRIFAFQLTIHMPKNNRCFSVTKARLFFLKEDYYV